MILNEVADKDRELLASRQRMTNLLDKVTAQEQKGQDVVEELFTSKESHSTAQMEAANLKNQLMAVQASESRLMQENQFLVQEKSRLNALIENLSRLRTDFERAELDQKKRLEKRVEVLEADLIGSRKRVTDITEEIRVVCGKREAEAHEFQVKVEKIVRFSFGFEKKCQYSHTPMHSNPATKNLGRI